MITLVIGGSGSGKSAYAESLLDDYKVNKFYLATMIIYGEEGQKKVERHRRLRAGKGFETIECARDVAEIVDQLPEDGSGVVLLECMSNLMANEMFRDDQARAAVEVTAKLVMDIKLLASRVRELVIITNNVSEDGIVYDKDTMNYIRAISDFNVAISEVADRVVEVVVGIPLVIKEK